MVVGIGDSSDALTDGVIRRRFELAASIDGLLVLFDGRGNLGILSTRQRGSQNSDLVSLLQGEGEPVLLFSSELLLRSKGHWDMEERGSGAHDNVVLAQLVDSLLTELERCCEVVLPYVASRDKTKRKDKAGSLRSGNGSIKLSRLTIEVDVKTSDRELSSKLKVRIKTAVVSREDDLRGDWSKGAVCSGELLSEAGGSVQNKDGLVDLDPFRTCGLQLSQELLVGREDLVE